MPDLQLDNNLPLAAKIAKAAGVNPWECYQCGKCSAGCPMAHAMDLQSRQIVRCIQLGDMDTLLSSKAIWLCATCHACVDRCPNDINIPGLVENARYEAKARGICAVKEVDVFHTVFLSNVKSFGRSQEAYLEGVYNVKTGHLVQDMANAPHMMLHGLTSIELNTVEDRQGVEALMKRAGEEDEQC